MISRTTLVSLAALGLLASFAPSQAWADKDASVAIYKKGKKKYNLGEFEQAIVFFKQAYDEYEAPAYLYNIAQAYRQMDNCKKALFFYERFLAEKPDSKQEETIQGYVDVLEKECGDKGSDPGALNEVDAPVAKPPAPAASTPAEPTAEADTAATEADLGVASQGSEAPRGPLVVATAEAGAAYFNMGDVVVPLSATLRLGAAYPMQFGDIDVEPGVTALLSNMAYDHAMGDSSALFTSILANVAAMLPLAPKVRVGGELGLGIFRFSAVDAGNPFTTGGAEQSDAATSFSLRVGGTAEYALSEAMRLSVSPAITYASAHEELADDIGSVTNLQLLGGMRYRY